MSKIELSNVLGTYDVTKINANFAAIKAVLDNKVVFRENPAGTPNNMKSNFDMDGRRILNLGAPLSDSEPLRRGDVDPSLIIDSVRAVPTTASFSGNGIVKTFTLPKAVLNASYVDVYIGAAYQHKGTYTVAGNVLTFNTAPAVGVNNIEVTLNAILPMSYGEARTTEYVSETSEKLNVQDVLTDLRASNGELVDAVDTIEDNILGIDITLAKVDKKLEAWVSAKEFGAVGGVQEDQGSKIQAAWDASAAAGVTFLVDDVYWVALTDKTYSDGLVRKVGLQVPSNSRCVFAPGAAIKTLPTTSETGYTINAYLTDNFEIIDPVVYGERDEHMGVTGEWVHCFNLVNCTNGYLHRPVARNAWGDGIYLGVEHFSATNKQTKNVTLFEARVYRARRNGFSVCSGIDLSIIRPYAEAIDGTWPKSGIDFEPEYGGATVAVCENWLVEHPTTRNCIGAGITVYTDSLPANSSADIRIIGHKDRGSMCGAAVQHGTKVVGGKVVFTNPHWEKSRANGLAVKTTTNGPRLYVIDPIIEDCGDAQPSIGWTYDSAVGVGRDLGEPAAPTIGNFSLTGLRVRDTRAVKKTSFAVHSTDLAGGNGGAFSNAIIEVVEDSGSYPGRMALFKQPDASVRITITDVAPAVVSSTRSDNLFFRTVKMDEAATENVNITLGSMRQPLSAIKMCQFYSFGIFPQADSRIYPLAVGVGKGIYSNDPGASINLHPTGAKDWIVEIVSGTWVAIP